MASQQNHFYSLLELSYEITSELLEGSAILVLWEKWNINLIKNGFTKQGSIQLDIIPHHHPHFFKTLFTSQGFLEVARSAATTRQRRGGGVI